MSCVPEEQQQHQCISDESMTDRRNVPGQVQNKMSGEEVLKKKYGGLLPKKKLMPRDNQYFDSADWQMNKQRGFTTPSLQPKLEPTRNPSPQRRPSQLGGGQ